MTEYAGLLHSGEVLVTALMCAFAMRESMKLWREQKHEIGVLWASHKVEIRRFLCAAALMLIAVGPVGHAVILFAKEFETHGDPAKRPGVAPAAYVIWL